MKESNGYATKRNGYGTTQQKHNDMKWKDECKSWWWRSIAAGAMKCALERDR